MVKSLCETEQMAHSEMLRVFAFFSQHLNPLHKDRQRDPPEPMPFSGFFRFIAFVGAYRYSLVRTHNTLAMQIT